MSRLHYVSDTPTGLAARVGVFAAKRRRDCSGVVTLPAARSQKPSLPHLTRPFPKMLVERP
ncbi:hypothetical protein QWZ13_00935 [Reinekea marina]|uniref:hypothetical protein n=1 Tax=Reinekea marina TaxID=1310421 RepID=UPI0025B2A351|nr:hypothetical protein [Reinekea marina]MDN3647467.1 hypothetical protein [Reinekea marina]